jgi:hypothetical protein
MHELVIGCLLVLPGLVACMQPYNSDQARGECPDRPFLVSLAPGAGN